MESLKDYVALLLNCKYNNICRQWLLMQKHNLISEIPSGSIFISIWPSCRCVATLLCSTNIAGHQFKCNCVNTIMRMLNIF